MHTSTVLTSGDFTFRAPDGTSRSFEDFFPHYHIQDRTAVVCCRPENAVAAAGPALLAIATAFYDVLRDRGEPFFDYPLNFAFLGNDPQRTGPSDGEDVDGAPWSNLDVWPETQWVSAPSTAAGMLDEAYRYQINRLLWPADLTEAGKCEGLLPEHARRLLGSRLKSVYTYGGEDDDIELTISARAAEIMTTSLGCVPGRQGDEEQENLPRTVGYQRVETDRFLAAMEGCFGDRG